MKTTNGPCAVRGRRTTGEDDEPEDPVMQGLRDDVARGVLDAGVSASMTTKQEVLADQQHN